jgi:hypothetical protein
MRNLKVVTIKLKAGFINSIHAGTCICSRRHRYSLQKLSSYEDSSQPQHKLITATCRYQLLSVQEILCCQRMKSFLCWSHTRTCYAWTVNRMAKNVINASKKPLKNHWILESNIKFVKHIFLWSEIYIKFYIVQKQYLSYALCRLGLFLLLVV